MNLITPLLCLAATIFFEAGGEPEQGKVQVAHVVMNRAADDSRVCEEVKKPGQFSWVPLFKRGKLKIDRTSEMWEDSLQLAKDVLNGEYDSSNKGFTYFHSSRINPGWRTKEKPTKIGGQVFYRIKYDNGYSSESASPLKKSISSSSDDSVFFGGVGLDFDSLGGSTSKGGSESSSF